MQFTATGLESWDAFGINAFGAALVLATGLAFFITLDQILKEDSGRRKVIRRATIGGLITLAFVGVAVNHFVAVDQKRDSSAVLAQEVNRVYGIPISEDVATHLLTRFHDPASLAELAVGGDQQMIRHYGDAEFIVDGERYNMTLSWVEDQWVLLEGNPDRLNEADRADS